MTDSSVELEERKCSVCGHEAADADELQSHWLSHFGVRYVAKQFKCPHCLDDEGFVARSVDDLREHIVSTHEKMSDYRCPICDYRSSEKQSMDEHVSSAHEIAFKLQCSQCSYNTPHAGHLKKHMKTRHNNVREYSCKDCPSSYSYHGNLVAHVNKRHPKAAAALSGKVETKAEERRENPGKTNSSNPGKTNSIQLSIPGKANSIQLSIPGKANSIKLRVPSKERGNGNRVSSHGWHTSVVCPQCDYNPTSETDLKNHVQIAHVLNHEERVAANDGVEHSSEAASEAAVTATPQGLSTGCSSDEAKKVEERQVLVLVTSKQLQGSEVRLDLPADKPDDDGGAEAKTASQLPVIRIPIVSKEASTKVGGSEAIQAEKQSPLKKKKTCSECSYTSSHQASLNMHFRKSHKAPEDNSHAEEENTDRMDSEPDSSRVPSKQVIIEIAGKELTNYVGVTEVTQAEKQSPLKTKKSCSECSYTSSHQASLNMHIRKTHKATSDDSKAEDENTDKVDSEPDSSRVPSEQGAIEIAGKEVTDNVGVTEVIQAEKQSPLKTKRSCSECSYTSSHQASLNMHIRKTHTAPGDGGKAEDKSADQADSEPVSTEIPSEQSLVDIEEDDDDLLIEMEYEENDAEMEDDGNAKTNDSVVEVTDEKTKLNSLIDDFQNPCTQYVTPESREIESTTPGPQETVQMEVEQEQEVSKEVNKEQGEDESKEEPMVVEVKRATLHNSFTNVAKEVNVEGQSCRVFESTNSGSVAKEVEVVTDGHKVVTTVHKVVTTVAREVREDIIVESTKSGWAAAKSHKNRKQKCPHCWYETGVAWQMERHLRDVHPKVKTHKCPMPNCDYNTTKKDRMAAHVIDSHDRETYETCPKCDYQTTRTEKMHKHIKKAHEMEHKCPKCSYKSNSKFHWHRHVVNNHGIQTVSMANRMMNQKKSEKSSEKRSSAERTAATTAAPKFPHPVPAVKSNSPPAAVKPVNAWVKPVKAWVKPVKTTEKLVCPWPKCGFTGDNIFLAAHLRVHEKFSDQVRRATSLKEVRGNGAFAGRFQRFVGHLYNVGAKQQQQQHPHQQQPQQQQQFLPRNGPKKSRWGLGPVEPTIAEQPVAPKVAPIIRSCPECDHKTTDLVLHFKRRHSEEAAIVQEFYHKKKYSSFGIRRVESH